MKVLRIFDHDVNTNCLVDLSLLVKAMDCFDLSLLTGTWELISAEPGYGDLVCRLSDEILENTKVVILGEEVFHMLEYPAEYFFDCEFRKSPPSLEIGIFDSEFIFVRSEDESLINHLIDCFHNTQVK